MSTSQHRVPVPRSSPPPPPARTTGCFSSQCTSTSVCEPGCVLTRLLIDDSMNGRAGESSWQEFEPASPQRLVLMATRETQALLRRALADSAELREHLRERHRAADDAVTALTPLADDLHAARARSAELARRHADDGAEDRRYSPGLEQWRWLVILVVATFDVMFLAAVFQNLLSNDRYNNQDGPLYEKVGSYIPGIGIFVALWLAGRLLAGPYQRWRHSRDGCPPDDLRRPPRKRDLIIPVTFTLLLLAVIGAWAHQRTVTLNKDDGQYATWAVVLLMVMLAVTAVTLECIGDNPFLIDAKRRRKELKAAERRWEQGRKEAARDLDAYCAAWRSLRDRYVSARAEVEEVWSCLHWWRASGWNLPENDVSAATDAIGPAAHGNGTAPVGAEPGRRTRDADRPWEEVEPGKVPAFTLPPAELRLRFFDQIPDLRPQMERLDELRMTLVDHHPAALNARYAQLTMKAVSRADDKPVSPEAREQG